jgi:hypothetical protein
MSIFVVDNDRRLLGVIGADQSRSIMADVAAFEPLIIAQDLMQETGFPIVSPSDTLADVMKRLARYRGEVPVVSNGRVIGTIWPEDVLERYNAELFKRDMATGMVSTVQSGPRAEPLPAVEDTSIVEIPIPPGFVGRSLISLDVRNRYECTILLIKQRDAAGKEVLNAVPSADYVFRPRDVILVMGPNAKLRLLEHGG